jgi:hypothetical protein
VSSFDHFVTQWMSTVIVSLGRLRNSSHVQVRGRSTAPRTVKLQSAGGVFGVGPADSTGNPDVTYWPGGTRAGSTSVRRLLWKFGDTAITLTGGAGRRRPAPGSLLKSP